MIVMAQNLVLSPPDGTELNTPVFGWQSIATAGLISASSTASGYTAADLANPLTVLKWSAADPSPAVDVYLTIDVVTVEAVDYVAIAGHNWGSAGIAFSLEIATALEGSPAAPNWTQVIAPRLVVRDDPLILRFTPQSVIGLRVRLQPGTAPAEAAVLHAGRLLVMPRGTSDDHVPINLGRQTRRIRQTSQNGHFLGEVLLSEARQTSIAFKHLVQSWARATFRDFLDAAKVDPFFFAWRPNTWPDDVGYCTLANDPQLTIDFSTERMATDLQLEAVAL